MAHFARLDSNNKVLKVHVVDNDWVLDGDGNESEAVGNQFLQNLYKTTDTFVQCSINATIRSFTPGKGDTYNPTEDRFEKEQPEGFPSWVRNSSTGIWEPPIPKPAVTSANELWGWEESSASWVDFNPDNAVEESSPE